MAAFDIKKEFKRLGTDTIEMSPLVRSRLDDTYALLSQQAKRGSRPRASRVRRLVYASTASGVLAVGLLASASLSPAMAGALNNLPVIGSLFGTIQGDMGLRIAGSLGLTATVNRAVAYEDVKLEVPETLYDGTRIAFLLNVTAPNLDDGIYDNGKKKKKIKLSNAVENLSITVDGKPLEGGAFYGSAGDDLPNTLVFEQSIDPSTAPDSFDSIVTITLDGIDHEFALNIPFTKTTVKDIEIEPNAVTVSDDLTFSVSKLWATPMTTRLTTSIALADATELTDKEQRRLIKIGVAVYDDQGRRLTALNGEGVIEGNRLVFDRRFASQPGTTDYLVVKPFVIEDDFAEDVKDHQFLKGLETRIELPAAK